MPRRCKRKTEGAGGGAKLPDCFIKVSLRNYTVVILWRVTWGCRGVWTGTANIVSENGWVKSRTFVSAVFTDRLKVWFMLPSLTVITKSSLFWFRWWSLHLNRKQHHHRSELKLNKNNITCKPRLRTTVSYIPPRPLSCFTTIIQSSIEANSPISQWALAKWIQDWFADFPMWYLCAWSLKASLWLINMRIEETLRLGKGLSH